MRTIIVTSALAVSIGALAGCGGATPSHGGIAVVAAENAYGDIAQQIGGEHVRVTSILSEPDADPHLFEPDSSNGLAIATARVVIENGLGYDTFMTRLVDASPNSKRLVLTIADVLHLAGRDTNPHLWYDVPELGRIAGAIAGALERADPAHVSAYRAGLARFDASLEPLRREVAHIRASYRGAPVAYTEPIAGYLVDAAGLKNLAPSAFTRAIEDGSEPTPRAFAAMTELMTRKRIKVLLYNSQATSPVTTRVRSAAEHAHIPVAGFSETLPQHLSFQAWQLAQARELAAALAR